MPALLVPACIIQLAGPGAAHWLRYEREAIAAGQLWRLISGHLVHLGWLHLALNGIALWVIVAGFGGANQPRPLRMSVALFSLMLGVSLGLFFSNPALDWYVGLSGVLHGLLVLAAFWWLELRVRVVLLVGLLLKLGWEQLRGGGSVTGLDLGGAVVTDAHLYGVATAALLLVAGYGVNAARKRA